MSWQNLVVSFILRKSFRPASLKKGHDVEAARRHARKRLFTPKVPRGWRLRETYGDAHAPLKGEWLERASAGTRAVRTVLYLHGGGYYFCSPQTHRAITFALAAGADASVFSLDYRLAPEHRFPAALDDALAAYRQLVANGTAAQSIVMAGDSAGGGLVLAALAALRDAGDALPAAAVLFSPWTDLAATGASLIDNESTDVMFSGAAIAPAGKIYLGDAPADTPLASPLYADLAGLPPLLIQVSAAEVLRDDSTRVAAKVRAAGGTVQIDIWPGLPHVWQIFTPFVPEARRALAQASAFVRAATPVPDQTDQTSAMAAAAASPAGPAASSS
jgi:monoterpene epsilon-lactone hydrolase